MFCMFNTNAGGVDVSGFENRWNIETHQHKHIRRSEKRKRRRRCHSDRQSTNIQKEKYISSRSCTLLSSLCRLFIAWLNVAKLTRLYRVCVVKWNHITSRHLFHRQSAKWFVFIIILLHFFMSGGLCFYDQNSWFSDTIFEHHNSFFIEHGAMNIQHKRKAIFSMFLLDFDSKIVVFCEVLKLAIYHRSSIFFCWWFSCLLVFFTPEISCHIIQQFRSRSVFSITFFFRHRKQFLRGKWKKSNFKSHKECFKFSLNDRKLRLRSIHPLFWRRKNKQQKKKNVAMTRRYFSCKLIMTWQNGRSEREKEAVVDFTMSMKFPPACSIFCTM